MPRPPISCCPGSILYPTVRTIRRIDAFKQVLEKTLESPLDSKEVKPVNPKGNQHWIFIGRTITEAEAPILWLPDAKSQLNGKRPWWCWERLKAKAGAGGAEDEVVSVFISELVRWIGKKMDIGRFILGTCLLDANSVHFQLTGYENVLIVPT